MSEQEALVPDSAAIHIWRRYIDGDNIAEGPWLRACSENLPVGDCPCGGQLLPRRPERVGSRTDYTAICRNATCSREICAPGGRLRRPRQTTQRAKGA